MTGPSRVLRPEDHGLAVRHERPDIPGPVQDVAGVLAPALAAAPTRTALLDRHGRYTFAQLEEAVQRATGALRAMGVGPGDRFAACARNHNQLVIAFLACQRLGAVWVGVARPLAPPEKRALLQDAGARWLLADRDVAAELRALGLPLLRVLIVDPAAPDCPWRALLRRARPLPAPPSVDPFAPAAIAYTSGTTGAPKGAVHSQHNLVLLGAVARASRWYDPDLPHAVVLPLTTLNLMVLGPLHTLQLGAACVLVDQGRGGQLARWIRQAGVGHFTAVPTIYYDLLTDPTLSPEDLRSLVQPEMGGAHIPPTLRERYRALLGKDLCVGYGMTEAPATVTRTAPGERFEPGLVGQPLPQYELELRDTRDRPVAPGQVGEVVVRGAAAGPFAGVYTPMLGYWGRPADTRAALRGARYYTGDLGRLERGRLYILGRAKEMILRGGANVYPAEVERVLHDQPGVVAASVFGVPDERLGERVVAAVQRDPAQPVDAAALREACRARLAGYKCPQRIFFVEHMPRNAMGKVRKEALRAALT